MTEDLIVIALEMLGISAGAIVYRVDKLGLNAVAFAALAGPQTAEVAIRASIAALSAQRITVCTGVINLYISEVDKSAGVSITGGGIDSVPGLGVDFEKRIQSHKDRLKMYLPFWDDWETMQQRNKGGGSTRCAVTM